MLRASPKRYRTARHRTCAPIPRVPVSLRRASGSPMRRPRACRASATRCICRTRSNRRRRGRSAEIVTFPPDAVFRGKVGAREVESYFRAMGSPQASTYAPQAPHPYMQKVRTLDFCLVLEGEITLVLDTEEVDLKAGDTVIQRGTNHAWSIAPTSPRDRDLVARRSVLNFKLAHASSHALSRAPQHEGVLCCNKVGPHLRSPSKALASRRMATAAISDPVTASPLSVADRPAHEVHDLDDVLVGIEEIGAAALEGAGAPSSSLKTRRLSS